MHSLKVYEFDPLLFKITSTALDNDAFLNIKRCQIGMQGPHLCAKPCHFCNLEGASSKKAFLDLKLHSPYCYSTRLNINKYALSIFAFQSF